MDAMLDMVRNIGSPVEPLSIDILEQNMCSGVMVGAGDRGRRRVY